MLFGNKWVGLREEVIVDEILLYDDDNTSRFRLNN